LFLHFTPLPAFFHGTALAMKLTLRPLSSLMGAAFLSLACTSAVAQSPSRALDLIHQLEPEKAAVLQKLIEAFNRAHPEQPIAVVQKDWQTNPALPHLMILETDSTVSLLANPGRYKPVHALMKEAGVPLENLKPTAQVARTVLDPKGQLNALPVGLSTPVMYYNRHALRQAGLNPDAPPKTWVALQEALGQLADKGHRCPYTVAQPGRVMIENGSAWHNQPYTSLQGKQEVPSFNTLFQIKHVAMMASWSKARYLHIFASEREAENRFAAGECAVLAGSSASYPRFRSLDVGVAPLPYYDDIPGAPQNTLADGPALWVANGKAAGDYKTVARFVRFWLEPAQQALWQREAGYLPLNRGGILASTPASAGPETEHVRVAVAQLNHKPPTPLSSASFLTGRQSVRAIIDQELAKVWQQNLPAKTALDTAVERSRMVR
jgi:sn-glycerol 3-phosphate transport system substrate-binding protein